MIPTFSLNSNYFAEFAPHFGVYLTRDELGNTEKQFEYYYFIRADRSHKVTIDSGFFWPFGNLPLIILNEVCERLFCLFLFGILNLVFALFSF